MVLLFLSLFFTFAFGALFYHPIIGVMGYMFVYLGFTSSTWWGETLLEYPIRYSLVMSLCLIMGFILHRSKLPFVTHGSRRREILTWVFFLVITISYAFASIQPEDSQLLLEKMLKLGVFLFVFSRIVTDLKSFRWVVKTMCILGFWVGWNAYNAPGWMFLTGRLDYLGNADYSNANTLASLLSMLLCFAGIQIFQNEDWKMRFVWLLCAAFITNAIVLCQSRGVFMGIAIAAVIALWAAPKSPKNLRRNILIGIFLGALLFLYMIDESFIDRVTAFDDYGEEASSAGRLEIWTASVPLLLDHPFGVGIGNFKEYIGNYNRDFAGRDAHNTIVRCYGDLGIQGLFVFMMVYLTAFNELKRIQNKVLDSIIEYEVNLYLFGIFCALVITFIAGLFSTVLYIEFFWWLLVMPICLERSVNNEIKKSDPAMI